MGPHAGAKSPHAGANFLERENTMRIERKWEAGQFHWVLRGVVGIFAGMPMGNTYEEAKSNLAAFKADVASGKIRLASPETTVS